MQTFRYYDSVIPVLKDFQYYVLEDSIILQQFVYEVIVEVILSPAAAAQTLAVAHLLEASGRARNPPT